MKRGIREHDAQKTIFWRDSLGHSGIGPSLHQHNGTTDAREHLLFERADIGQRARCFEVGHHERERFFVSVFSLPKDVRGAWVARVYGEVEATQPLHRDDVPERKHARSLANGIASHRRAIAIEQFELRTARGAGNGLGVEATIDR